jgi:glycosyltransferase involved in cell wall biosynthesis
VRILVDYRPALRARTGVGEYVHGLVAALLRSEPAAQAALSLFTSSWKDRPTDDAGRDLAGARMVDRRVPVRLLTWAWNRLRWPMVEALAGPQDVVHSATPLIIPSRAAGVVTIHDLHFLRHPEGATAEMRRDFPTLVRRHAAEAHAIVVSSSHAAADVVRTLAVPAERVYCCPPGPPAWALSVAADRAGRTGRDILFVGTLEPRKNVGVLLDAYAALRSRHPAAPPLVLAGTVPRSAWSWVERIGRAPLSGHVRVTGYVSDAERCALFTSARMLVVPSLDEGFGLPVLEAMAAGVPVVISSGGSLPEVAGPAASPVDPLDSEGFAAAMSALLDEDAAREAGARGQARAREFSWAKSAASMLEAYRQAMARR